MKKEPIIIALAGKGGVGKTSLSGAFVKALVESHPDKKILAIDADPAVGLATVLGIEPKLTIDDIRNSVIAEVENGQEATAMELLSQARYKIFEALVEKDGFSFIAIGRPETSGCYCKINSYLKDVIAILSNEFDYVVIDGEAGIEQINRRVMEKVTHLILVSDLSKKGIQVIHTIKDVADDLVMYKEIGVIFNRVTDINLLKFVNIAPLKLLSTIESDNNLIAFDVQGLNIFNLPNESNIVKGAKIALDNLNII